MFDLGRSFIFIGILLVTIGVVLLLLNKVPGLGKFPGDILIERKNYTFYFPIVSCILMSLLLSFIFWFMGKK